MSADSPASQDEPALPSVEVRTVVSFLIVVHLFAVFAGLAFTPGMSSQLGQRLASLPALTQYRQLFDMNLAYTYHLMFGGEELDYDHQIDVELELADGATRTVTIPPADIWPRSRNLRYQMLALNTASMVGQDTVEGTLPQGITSALLDQNDATRGTFRCRVHSPLGRDRILAGADPQAADTWRTVYSAVIWKTDQGQVRLLKQESAMESAPGAAPTAAPADNDPTGGAPPPINPNAPLPATPQGGRTPSLYDALNDPPSERAPDAPSPMAVPPSR